MLLVYCKDIVSPSDTSGACDINACHAEFISGNIKNILHRFSRLRVTQAVEIFSLEIQGFFYPIVRRQVSAKLEISFATANFASAQAQLSKLERQRALPPNCGQIMKKQQLFIFRNSITIHPTSTLHNTFYFNKTWMKIQLQSGPVNMQPDKTKSYPQRPITMYGLLPVRCWVHLSEAPPPNSGTLSLHMEGNCRIPRGFAGYWNVTLATTRRQVCLDVLRPIFDVGKAWCYGSLKFV